MLTKIRNFRDLRTCQKGPKSDQRWYTGNMALNASAIPSHEAADWSCSTVCNAQIISALTEAFFLLNMMWNLMKSWTQEISHYWAAQTAGDILVFDCLCPKMWIKISPQTECVVLCVPVQIAKTSPFYARTYIFHVYTSISLLNIWKLISLETLLLLIKIWTSC